MPWKSDPEIWSVVVSVIVAIISGLIAIANRLAAGQKFSWLWFLTQLGGALLAGYLMWDVYPVIKDSLPQWCTKPIMVSIAAHYGGKIFNVAELLINRRFSLPSGDAMKPD